ncbi:MAG: DUF5686 and carboxypeptidase regulatory-like domain-containing protein [Muribaculaceae bacterium]|nr:DUF5686 and carboxypeptidase regulatory-like domain-containing protein [Muribaculaceae bacterium]
MIADLRRLFLLIISLLIFTAADAMGVGSGYYFISGIVRDVDTMEPLPYAAVKDGDEAISTLTNEQGVFELTIPDDTKEITVTCLGYQTRTVGIKKNKINLYDVMLKPSTTELNEVVVHRSRYSKKNNPALDLARKLRQGENLTDPRRNPYFNYDKHEVTTLALNDFGSPDKHNALFKQFPFLWEHVDTSEISGKPILNVIVKEKLSEVHYRREPHAEKEVVTGVRQEGIDEMANQKNFSMMLEDFLPEINLYDNDIDILQNKFVSPLSKIAPDFYKFYLTDTVDVGDERCLVLSFYPHNPQAFGFNGQLYVPVNDTTMFVKKIDMRVPRGINLNFIDRMSISQEFDRAADGSRLKKRDDVVIEASLVPGTQGLFVRRNMAFDDHNFDEWSDTTVYDIVQPKKYVTEAEMRPDEFWDLGRILTLTENEKRVGTLMDKMREVPIFYWSEKILKILFLGYVQTGNPSKIDLGPVNTLISFNPVEGVRLRVGGITTASLDKRWFGRLYTAYGTKDHRWKYGLEAEYSFTDKKQHSREFPVHSLRFSSSYDLDNIGQHYLYTNRDNVFVSLQRLNSYNSIYRWLNELKYSLELYNNFSLYATLQTDRREATAEVPFVDGFGRSYGHYVENALQVQLRYAPGEKFMQAQSYRMAVNRNAPVLTLTHTIAPKGFGGSTFGVNKTEIGFEKRFWLSAFGYIDTELTGGHVWSRSPYPNLLIPNANLSFTIQRGTFTLMNPMEFINDSYASLHLDYWANGAILNYIPLIKKLKLREVFTFKGLYGHLSHRNDPAKNPELFRFPADDNVTKMTHTPYMEVSAGIDNVFKVLRLDYVWRLTYLDVPYHIDRRGLRISLHVRF